MDSDSAALNQETRDVWNANAAFWDDRMADGNLFQRLLVGPATERLLGPKPGELIVEAACGNGVMARRLAGLGVKVVAFDFAADMVEHARSRSRDQADGIEFHTIDGTDVDAMLALGVRRFDGGICNMAIMDMAEIDPLMQAMSRLIRPGGRFVFALCHPCFNQTSAIQVIEREESGGDVRDRYFVKVHQYLTPRHEKGVAIIGQPRPQWYFERSLQDLLGACFRAGMVVDGIEEPAFPPSEDIGSSVWKASPEIPPVLAVRARIQP